LLWEHLQIKLTATDFDTKVGSEWYPYDSSGIPWNTQPSPVSRWWLAISHLNRRTTRRCHYPIFFLLFSTALMIMTARWKRIAEYWPPFAILFAGFSLQPWLEGFRPYLTRLPAEVLEELKPFLDREVMPPRRRRNDTLRDVLQTVLSVVAVVLSVFLFFNSRARDRKSSRVSRTTTTVPGAMDARECAAGTIVFNTDWDDFPRLFYFDPTHYYVSGLDPSYLYDKNRTSRVFTTASHSAKKRIRAADSRSLWRALRVFRQYASRLFRACESQRLV
jgi:hypothetical protein